MSISSRTGCSWKPRCRESSCPSPVLWACLALLSGPVCAAEKPELPTLPAVDRTLPIDLSADFSEFDRRNDRLTFRGLHITQGPLSISADAANANPADFEDSTWTFTGSVVVSNGNTRATADRAVMTFRQNELRKATLSGKPARFTQERPGGGAPTEGHAEILDYDLGTGSIRMTTDALLSDGTNEIAGNHIVYDLRREVVSAGEAGQGPVRMKFIPKKDGEKPPAEAPAGEPGGAAGAGTVPAPEQQP